MPPGAGIATTTVHVVSGVFGTDHGTTEMRPAPLGLLEPQVDTIFCSVVQDAAW